VAGDAVLVEVLERSRALGLLGPGPVDDHIRHAAVFAQAYEELGAGPPARFVDLGSGGGVPGLVLAVTWAESEAWLLDGQLRRVRFLLDALEDLGIDERVHAVHGRAEELAHEPAHRDQADVVTARSFATPGITAECGIGFLRPGGALLVAEPPDERADRWPVEPLASIGLVDDGTTRTPSGSVRRLRRVGELPPAIPRRSAAMHRRPLF
jgi:16S rRNA (guanine527-N7)-methyltransferase